jgi:hypothetical protein
MSLNDFENSADVDVTDEVVDAVIKSKIGKATNGAIRAREAANRAFGDAIDATYLFGHEVGEMDLRQRLLDWIEENRSAIELEDGVFMYRDHFSSEDLIVFIKSTE